MYLYRSNRLERLLDALVPLVQDPGRRPTEPQSIVVPHRALAGWTSARLARRLGIWANPDFPSPRQLLERLLEGRSERPDPEALSWSIATFLEELKGSADSPEPSPFRELRAYVTDDRAGPRTWGLARRIATVFDRYALYRPEMIDAWERDRPLSRLRGVLASPPPDWQPALWRALVQRGALDRMGEQFRKLIHALENDSGPLPGWGDRCLVFGVRSLPPLYLHLLEALAKRIDVHLFVVSPSREYWADIRSRHERPRGRSIPPDEGHPLLSSLARSGREFHHALESIGYVDGGQDLYEDPGGATSLTALQSAILRLKPRRPTPRPSEQASIPSRIDLEVHRCHSPRRELEVLHDRLLGLFEDHPDLQPRDVAVLAPRLQVYRPLVEAVFDRAQDRRPRIPFHLANPGETAGPDALLKLLAVVEGRMTATAVLDAVATEPVRRRFELSLAQLERIRQWVENTHIRWGVDEHHRAQQGQLPRSHNTWRFGLDRLLLGYAGSSESAKLFRGVLPYEDPEDLSPDVLGPWMEFCETLFAFRQNATSLHSVSEWCSLLSDFAHAMIAGESSEGLDWLREVLLRWERQAAAASYVHPVSLGTIRRYLTEDLNALRQQRVSSHPSALAGGVQFGEVTELAGLPFSVVCLIGMNEDAFPRGDMRLPFDQLAVARRPGDPSLRDDDRHSFLHALLSARRHVLITFVGHELHREGALPPSSVVTELMEHLNESDGPDGWSFVEHPRHAYDPKYFAGQSGLTSYSEDDCRAAQALAAPRHKAPAFIRSPLPPAVESSWVTLEELQRFFRNPSRFLVERRLSLYLRDEQTTLPDHDPTELSPLDRWSLGHDLLQRTLGGEDLEEHFARLTASGGMPPYAAGRLTYEQCRPDAQAVAAATMALFSGERFEPVNVDVTVGATRVTGTLHDVWRSGQIGSQYGRVGRPSELSLWIRHVALGTTAGDPAPRGLPRDTWLVGRDPKTDRATTIRFRPLDQPHLILERLLALYWAGQRAPLPLFPAASRSYGEARQRGDDVPVALQRLQHEWNLGRYPEHRDPYVRQLFGGQNALQSLDASAQLGLSFVGVAEDLFLPLLNHRERVDE